jgi:hypothetical protein
LGIPKDSTIILNAVTRPLFPPTSDLLSLGDDGRKVPKAVIQLLLGYSLRISIFRIYAIGVIALR